jgi:hypothetical protein
MLLLIFKNTESIKDMERVEKDMKLRKLDLLLLFVFSFLLINGGLLTTGETLSPPIITVTNPIIETVIVNNSLINITGYINDDKGIDGFGYVIVHPDGTGMGPIWLINPPVTNYSFDMRFHLSVGWTVLTLETSDIEGNTASKTVRLIYGLSYPPWDVNLDDNIDNLDAVIIGQHWGEMGFPGWIRMDVNSDGIINILDLVLVGQHWTG